VDIVIALLAPGQGSQTPGMLEPWLELDGARHRIESWSEATGLDLLRLGTTADKEEIKDTAVTQPLIVALSLLAAAELERRVSFPAETVVAGHSVGELAASAVAGVLDFDDAVALAAVRGREMAAACALEPTGMSAVLGGDRAAVLARLAELELDPANQNGTGQIVAAGAVSALEKLAADAPDGARVRALPVAGAFHTRFMAPAKEALSGYAATVTARDPARVLLSNADGEAVDTGATALSRLVDQVTKPVRWDSCMAALAARGVRGVIEFPPAGTLAGMVKRELPEIARLPLKRPDDLDKVAEFLAENSLNGSTL
jgi:[acyl-carrier-protein] S-malonyltransferase